MIVVDNGDAIRGIAEVATKLDYTVNGLVGTTPTQLADGQLGTSEADLYLSSANATTVTSITIVNTDSVARTFTLYLKPSGGTSRAISPVSLDLGVGHTFYTDGQRIVVMDLNGGIVSSSIGLSNASPNTIEPDDTASSGSGSLASRDDHEHAIEAAAPSTVGSANSEGSSTSFARADHVHQREHAIYVDASAVSAVEAAGLTFAENKGIILDTLLSGDGKWSGITEAGIAGATIAVGDLVYLAVADTRWELTDADAEATAFAKLGICILAANDGAATNILLWGKVRSPVFPTFTVGAPVHVGTTAGDVQVTAPSGTTGMIVRIIGYGNTAEDLFFCPDNSYIKLA